MASVVDGAFGAVFGDGAFDHAWADSGSSGGQGLGEDGVRPGERGSTQQREACASCDTYGHGITSSVQGKSNSRSVSPRAMAVWP